MKRTRRASERAAQQSIEALAMTAAMPLAAMITLRHRLPLVAGAAVGSNSWDHPEFRRMAAEKRHAIGQAALAIGGAVTAGQQAIIDYAASQAKANLALISSLSSNPTAAFVFGSASWVRLARLTAVLSEINSRSVSTGLRPAHKRVTANAKRLAARAAGRKPHAGER